MGNDGFRNIRDLKVKYFYCASCGTGALEERREYVWENNDWSLQNWNRYQYEGLNLLRIDERWDRNGDGLDENDPWRPINTFVHGPGQISQVVRGTIHHTLTPALSLEGEGDLEVTHHEMTYVYDAVGNVRGALLDCVYYPFEMDAFGNRIEGTPEWPSMTAPGPKDRLTGKMYDDTVGLYYFHARWYDPGVGRFVSRDPIPPRRYDFCRANPIRYIDTTGLYPFIKSSCCSPYADSPGNSCGLAGCPKKGLAELLSGPSHCDIPSIYSWSKRLAPE